MVRSGERSHASDVCIPWLASKKHDTADEEEEEEEEEERGMNPRACGGFQKYRNASAKSNDRPEARREKKREGEEKARNAAGATC